MQMKSGFYSLMCCLALLSSCGQRIEVVGLKHCDLHDEKCLEEELEYLIGSISWSESHDEAMRSGAHKKALERLFPNSNNYAPLAVPGTEVAKEVENETFRRRYCGSCRASESAWGENWNKATEQDGAGQAPTAPESK